MKTIMFKFRALGLFTMMTLALFSCSDDDDNDASKSFLEKHGGTVWKFEEPVSGAAIYAQINSIESNPFEIWISFDGDCFFYESITDAGNIEVLENTENKVVIRIDEGPSEYSILQLTVTGDVLAVNNKYYEDGQLEEDDTFVLQRTNENPDELVECAF